VYNYLSVEPVSYIAWLLHKLPTNTTFKHPFSFHCDLCVDCGEAIKAEDVALRRTFYRAANLTLMLQHLKPDITIQWTMVSEVVSVRKHRAGNR
jgi:hypothetical protein